MKTLTRTILGAALTAAPALPLAAQETGGAAAVSCMEVPEPVVSLAYGSRYTEDSETRADLDEEANARVNEALGPIDDFISTLAARANTAVEDQDREAATCVIDALEVWAEANALSELETMNAQISSPSRVGAMALAYLQAKQVATDPTKAQETVETWLRARARAAAAYFDDEAPPMASRNNLRAWAGLAATAAGEATGDDWLTSWGAHTVATVACQADADGALPLEMERGHRALHYQLHAIAPLVVSSAFLTEKGYPSLEICDEAVPRIVSFAVRAFDDPGPVTEKAGKEQTFFTGDDEVRSFELAWAEAYLSLRDDPEVADFVESHRPLAHSKLGGDQSVLW